MHRRRLLLLDPIQTPGRAPSPSCLTRFLASLLVVVLLLSAAAHAAPLVARQATIDSSETMLRTVMGEPFLTDDGARFGGSGDGSRAPTG